MLNVLSENHPVLAAPGALCGGLWSMRVGTGMCRVDHLQKPSAASLFRLSLLWWVVSQHCLLVLWWVLLHHSSHYLHSGESCCTTVHTTSTVVSPAVPLFTLPQWWWVLLHHCLYYLYYGESYRSTVHPTSAVMSTVTTHVHACVYTHAAWLKLKVLAQSLLSVVLDCRFVQYN